jgi:hypothetical protein
LKRVFLGDAKNMMFEVVFSKLKAVTLAVPSLSFLMVALVINDDAIHVEDYGFNHE